MAIALDATSNSGSFTAATSATWSHAIDTGAVDRVLVAGAATQGTVPHISISTVTFNGSGAGWAQIRKDTHAEFGVQGTEMWYVTNPAATTANVVVTFVDSVDRGLCGAVSLTGVDQAAALDAHAGAQATSGTLSASVTTVADNCWLVGFMYYDDLGAVTVTVGTERYSVVIDGVRRGLAVTRGPVTPAGSYAVTATAASDRWTVSVASFKPSGGADAWGPLLALQNNRLVGV